MRSWKFIHGDGFKVIYASPEVEHLVKDTLSRRVSEILDERDVEHAWVDNPGMCLANRAIWRGEIDGLAIEIPVSDFPDFLRQLKEHLNDASFNSEKDAERGYRSVYGWMHCIAMTQEQYQMLHDLMVQEGDAMQARADEETEKLISVCRRANEQLAESGMNVRVESMMTNLTEVQGPIGGGSWN